MITNYWFSDDKGNVHEVFDIPKTNESIFHLAPPDHERFFGIEYPIIISLSGSGIWQLGARRRWARCTIFAIELVTAGNMYLIQDGKEYIIEKGMAFTLRPGTAVEMKVGDKGFVHKRFVIFAGPELDSLRKHCRLTDSDNLMLAAPSRLCALMKNATWLLRTRPENYTHTLALCSYDIMLTLARETSGTRYPPPVNAVLHFLSRNIERTVTIDELCAVACLSRSQLHRIFREHVADSPLNYFSKMRIRHASMVLRSSPHRTIGDIAQQYAFDDQAYFSNLFRKVMGVSPGEYRKAESSYLPASAKVETRR